MASAGTYKFTKPFDKRVTMHVDVKFTRRYRWRVNIGVCLLHIACWVLGCGCRVERDESS